MATAGRGRWWKTTSMSTGTAGTSTLAAAVHNRAKKAPPEVLMKIAEDKVPARRRIVRFRKTS